MAHALSPKGNYREIASCHTNAASSFCTQTVLCITWWCTDHEEMDYQITREESHLKIGKTAFSNVSRKRTMCKGLATFLKTICPEYFQQYVPIHLTVEQLCSPICTGNIAATV